MDSPSTMTFTSVATVISVPSTLMVSALVDAANGPTDRKKGVKPLARQVAFERVTHSIALERKVLVFIKGPSN